MNKLNKLGLVEKLSEEMKSVIKQQEVNALGADAPSDSSYPSIRCQYQKERAFWNQGSPVMDKVDRKSTRLNSSH